MTVGRARGPPHSGFCAIQTRYFILLCKFWLLFPAAGRVKYHRLVLATRRFPLLPTAKVVLVVVAR